MPRHSCCCCGCLQGSAGNGREPRAMRAELPSLVLPSLMAMRASDAALQASQPPAAWPVIAREPRGLLRHTAPQRRRWCALPRRCHRPLRLCSCSTKHHQATARGRHLPQDTSKATFQAAPPPHADTHTHSDSHTISTPYNRFASMRATTTMTTTMLALSVCHCFGCARN